MHNKGRMDTLYVDDLEKDELLAATRETNDDLSKAVGGMSVSTKDW